MTHTRKPSNKQKNYSTVYKTLEYFSIVLNLKLQRCFKTAYGTIDAWNNLKMYI